MTFLCSTTNDNYICHTNLAAHYQLALHVMGEVGWVGVTLQVTTCGCCSSWLSTRCAIFLLSCTNGAQKMPLPFVGAPLLAL